MKASHVAVLLLALVGCAGPDEAPNPPPGPATPTERASGRTETSTPRPPPTTEPEPTVLPSDPAWTRPYCEDLAAARTVTPRDPGAAAEAYRAAAGRADGEVAAALEALAAATSAAGQGSGAEAAAAFQAAAEAAPRVRDECGIDLLAEEG